MHYNNCVSPSIIMILIRVTLYVKRIQTNKLYALEACILHVYVVAIVINPYSTNGMFHKV